LLEIADGILRAFSGLRTPGTQSTEIEILSGRVYCMAAQARLFLWFQGDLNFSNNSL
jgi:hypothetical protein